MYENGVIFQRIHDQNHKSFLWSFKISCKVKGYQFWGWIMKNIGYVGGFWSTNIGNSFFNLGAEYILKRIFPEDNVVMISDQPGYWTFWNKKKGNPKNALDFIGACDLDYLVLLGPCLTESFGALWEKSFEKLVAKGTKIAIISAGQMKYTDEEIIVAKRVLRKYPPLVIATRDRKTYENFKDCAENVYCGIDAAFFVSDLYKPVRTSLGKYIVMNFDKLPEPRLKKVHDNTFSKNKKIKIGSNIYEIKFPSFKKWLGNKSDAFKYISALLPEGNAPDSIDRIKIVRTNNRYNPMFIKRVYKFPNSFASDVPYSYLNLHANAEITLSDRVHSCVASLAYGKPAILFKRTGRSGLLERVGAHDIQDKPVTINQDNLKNEKEQLIKFLKEVLK